VPISIVKNQPEAPFAAPPDNACTIAGSGRFLRYSELRRRAIANGDAICRVSRFIVVGEYGGLDGERIRETGALFLFDDVPNAVRIREVYVRINGGDATVYLRCEGKTRFVGRDDRRC
jgi:hypothetical protein